MAVLDQITGSTSPNGLRRVTNKQLRLWAVANGTPKHVYTIQDAIDPDPGTANSIFYSGADMIEGDALATAIKNALAMTDSEWSLAISAMLEYPE